VNPQHVLIIRRTRGLGEEVATALWDAGTTGVWEVSSKEWKAFFPAPPQDLPARLEALAPGLRAGWERGDDTDWAARYQESLKPIPLGERFVILPRPDLENPWPERAPIRLAPGMAFGTGEHFTTASSARFLEGVRPRPESLLDVGCGSGILAILGRLLGIPKVDGCDIDAEALAIAVQNGAANGVEARWEVGGADLFENAYGCVVANIEADVLTGLMGTLRRRLASGGTLILAGILWELRDQVLEAAEENGLSLNEMRTDGRWATLKMEG
jgi:ribosomal protein L11 methyltransferase